MAKPYGRNHREADTPKERQILAKNYELVLVSVEPLTTSHIGVENMRQIRSKVRNVMGFPASTFCQYLTEYPCESMSSWLSSVWRPKD